MAVTAIETPLTTRTPGDLRPARLWLALLIGLVFLMVLVGGATRLTGSGLSITEWKPIHGAIPPLTESAWQEELARYRETSQYQLLNTGMSLSEFQGIFWWEWVHRQLGRLIGLVYLAGFIWLLATRRVTAGIGAILFGMGLLLGMQGLVGWIMVASGLQPGMTAVAPIKLTLHLVLACLFFASLVVMYVRLGGAQRFAVAAGLRGFALALVVLAFVQIALGGLVAGHDAGLIYNTWPLMDGRFVPAGLTTLQPAWLNLVDNVTTIQFNHRLGAYVLSLAVIAFWFALRRAAEPVRRRASVLAILVLAQLALGIATLIHVVPLHLALAHQGTALLLLGALVWNAAAMRPATVR